MNQKTQQDLKELEKTTKQFHEALFNKSIKEDTIVNILSNTTNLDRQINRR